MALVDNNVFPKIITAVQATDQAAPSDGSWKIYSKAGGIYARSSNSVVGPFGAAAASGLLVTKRQGGSATVWATAGTTTYTPTTQAIQVGSVAAIANGGNAAVTFPTAFTYAPIVLVTGHDATVNGNSCTTNVVSVSTTGFTVYVTNPAGGTFAVYWMAIGE